MKAADQLLAELARGRVAQRLEDTDAFGADLEAPALEGVASLPSDQAELDPALSVCHEAGGGADDVRLGRAVLEDVNRSMKLIRYNDKGYFLDVEEIAERERPPMVEVPEYQEHLQALLKKKTGRTGSP